MKRFALMLAIVLTLATTQALAQETPAKPAEGRGGMGGMMKGGQHGEMRCMGMGMMRQMMAGEMTLQETLKVMREMVTIQERLVQGVKPAEKKQLLEEMAAAKKKIDALTEELTKRMKGMDHKPAAAPAGTPAAPGAAKPEAPAGAHQH